MIHAEPLLPGAPQSLNLTEDSIYQLALTMACPLNPQLLRHLVFRLTYVLNSSCNHSNC
jgi:hypothetical protein